MPSKTACLDFLGDHVGLDKYTFKYDTKNINDIRHLLAYHSNSTARFENSLRSYSLNKNNNSEKGIKNSLNSANKQNNNVS